MKSQTSKIKCWVVYDNEYPGGMIYRNRADALESSEETRKIYGGKAYTRVRYFTQEELENFPEAD